MFGVGSFQNRDCQGVTRRAFLQAGLTVPFALASGAQYVQAAPNAKAKSVLLIWLGGGPSHLDLFDPKPKAQSRFRGPFGTLQTHIPGARFTELLPKLAARSDRFSVIRTNVNFEGGHRPASSIALTGAQAPDGGEDRGGTPGQ